MSDVLKRVLCLVLALVVVFSFSACRHSPVLEQTVYTADGEVDPNNQQTDNDEEHSEEDTTLPPRTTKPDVSQKADQTRVSATKPRQNPQTRPNTNTNGQQSQQPTQAPSNNQSNTNKGTGEVPGVSEDPNSPAKAIDRNSVNREEVPEDVATVAAVGDAALYVEMLGGQNRLLASSASFTQNYYAQLFSDFSKVKGLWEKNGETAMTDAQFRQLLQQDVYPEAVFYIADTSTNTFQSFTEQQLAELNQKGVYTIPLNPFNTTDNIRQNVEVIGKVLGKGSKVPNAPNANSRAQDYLRWMDRIVSGKENQTFSGSSKWNLDKNGDFGSEAQVEDRYSDVGQYTILINGWDPDVSTSVDQGIAYAHTGYTNRTSPASYYLSIGGAANTAVMVADNTRPRDLPVSPMYQTTVYGNVNGGSIGKDYKRQMGDMTHFDGHYIGDGSFNTIIADSQQTKAAMESSDAWRNWGYQPYGTEDQSGYGRPNGDTMDFSNIHGDYKIIVNPYGIGSWTTGSPESPLEVLWAEQVFLYGQDAEAAFSAIREEVRGFYNDFYGVKLTDPDLDAIRDGI